MSTFCLFPAVRGVRLPLVVVVLLLSISLCEVAFAQGAPAPVPSHWAFAVDGFVTDVQDEDVCELSLTSSDGLKPGHVLEVYRKTPKWTKHLGQITVTATASDKSTGKFIPKKDLNKARPGKTPPKLTVQPEDRVTSFFEWVPDESQKNNRGTVGRILVNGKFTGNEQKLLENYYTMYEFRQWTLKSNRVNLAGNVVGVKRTDFRKDLINSLRRCGTGERPREVHKALTALTLNYMAAFATNAQTWRSNRKFLPATRVNAILMIGKLNKTEMAPGSKPVPLPEALHQLAAIANNEKNPDALKVAAMVGIIRHAKLGAADAADRNLMMETALKKISAPKATGKRAAGDAWLRAQAAEILQHLGTVGRDNKAVIPLALLVWNQDLPFYTRVAGAKALGELNYKMASRLNKGEQIVVALCRLAVDAVDEEIKDQKHCSDCGKVVPDSSKVGERCPHCNSLWSEKTDWYVVVSKPKSEDELPVTSPPHCRCSKLLQKPKAAQHCLYCNAQFTGKVVKCAEMVTIPKSLMVTTPISRARLKERLYGAGLGLKGLAGASGAPEKTAAHLKVIGEMINVLNNEELPDRKMIDQIRSKTAILRKVLPKKAKPATPAPGDPKDATEGLPVAP